MAQNLFNIREAALYVGTYKKYNEGSLFGEWITLSDFSSSAEFYDYCRQLHKDERDPEFMFQDYENLPACMYSECYISEKFWELLEALDDLSDDEAELFPAWIDYKGYSLDGDTAELVEKFRDALCGNFQDDSFWSPMKNYAYDNAAEWLGISYDQCEQIRSYIDYDAIEREMDIEGYFEIEGYIFRPAA